MNYYLIAQMAHFNIYLCIRINMTKQTKILVSMSERVSRSPGDDPIPSDRELLIQHLMGTEHPVRPVLQEHSILTGIETLLLSLLPIKSLNEENVRPAAESTVVCFLCGESGHATSRCPVLDDSFPFLPSGWQADRMDDDFILRETSSGKRRLIRGGGLVTRISKIYEPQIPVVSDDIPCPAARDVVVSRVGVVRPMETSTQCPTVVFRLGGVG